MVLCSLIIEALTDSYSEAPRNSVFGQLATRCGCRHGMYRAAAVRMTCLQRFWLSPPTERLISSFVPQKIPLSRKGFLSYQLHKFHFQNVYTHVCKRLWDRELLVDIWKGGKSSGSKDDSQQRLKQWLGGSVLNEYGIIMKGISSFPAEFAPKTHTYCPCLSSCSQISPQLSLSFKHWGGANITSKRSSEN